VKSKRPEELGIAGGELKKGKRRPGYRKWKRGGGEWEAKEPFRHQDCFSAGSEWRGGGEWPYTSGGERREKKEFEAAEVVDYTDTLGERGEKGTGIISVS